MIKAIFSVEGVPGIATGLGVTKQGAALTAMRNALYALDEMSADDKRDMLALCCAQLKRVQDPEPDRSVILSKNLVTLILQSMPAGAFRSEYERAANEWSAQEGPLAV